MEKSPLAKTLLALSPADRRSFRQFVESPFFNTRNDVRRLADYLLNHLFLDEKLPADRSANRAVGPSVLSKEVAFDHVFSTQNEAQKGSKIAQTEAQKTRQTAAPTAFDDGKMRHAMSILFSLLKDWMAQKEWAADPFAAPLARLKSLKKYRLTDLFESETARVHANLANSPLRNSDHFWQEYTLGLQLSEPQKRLQTGPADEEFSKLGQSFGAFVATESLRLGCAAISKQNRPGGLVEIPFLNETVAAIERGEFADLPAAQLYFQVFQALQNPKNETLFESFLEKMEANWLLFPPAEQRDLWVTALNFCIRRLNEGEKNYVRRAFNLYKTGFERRILLEDGELSVFSFKNALNLGLALAEWDWSLAFLTDFHRFLPQKERAATFKLSLATFHFRQKKYDTTLDLLREADFRDPLNSLEARRMLLRIFFERGEVQALESLLDSFTIFLRRRRASLGYQTESFGNLIRLTRRLLYADKNDPVLMEKLRGDIRETRLLAERDWLLAAV